MPSPSQHHRGTELFLVYLAIGLRHVRLLVLLVTLSLALGLSYLVFARSVYFSRSLVQVQRLNRPADRNVDAGAGFIDPNDQALLREFASDTIVIRAAHRLGVDANRSKIDREYLKKLSVSYNAQGDLVIEVYPYSQIWARRFPAMMVEEYLRYRDEKRQENRDLAIKSFTHETRQIQDRIDTAIKQQQNLTTDADISKLKIDFGQLSDVPRQILAIQQRLASMDRTRETLAGGKYSTVAKLALYAYDQQMAHVLDTQQMALAMGSQLSVGQTVQPATSNGTGDDAATVVLPSMVTPSVQPWEELEREQRKLLAQLRELEVNYGSRHPKVIAINQRLAEIGQALDGELDGVTKRFNLEYENLLQQKKLLQAKLPEMQTISERYERQMENIASADANRMAWRGLREQMTRLISSLGYFADKERVLLQFMGFLELRDTPVSPNKLKALLASIVLALAFVVSVPVAFYYLDKTVSDPLLIEQDLGLQMLGMIPDWQVQPNHGRPRSKSRAAGEETLEHFRAIRTNLLLRDPAREIPQVIMVSSALPNEGKTTVATNLALSLAQRGERTLLIDADIYRGKLHETFHIAQHPGLLGVLRDKLPAVSACSNVAERLDLLPRGKKSRNAGELLETPEFGRILAELREHYRCIVLDSPPILGLADVPLLACHTDATLMVVASERTPVNAVKDSLAVLRNCGTRVECSVLNRVDFSSMRYGYRYYYYSSDYYSRYTKATPVNGTEDQA